MKKKTIVGGLVNGDIVDDLLNLCNEFFINTGIREYAGANLECLYCGCWVDDQGRGDHSVADCPKMKYLDICEKYNKYIKDEEPYLKRN